MLQAITAGLSLLTHVSNAMPKTLADGPLGEGTSLYGGLILDGHHVRQPLLGELYGAMGPGRLFLVTDAAPCAGMPDGPYRLGEVEVQKQGTAVTVRASPSTLAGSALTLDEAVRNATRLLPAPLEEAVQMATQTPARALGLRDRGELSVGLRADFTLLDPQTLQVRATWVRGVASSP
jgi:N-acetylglucosamine-6-phosphate deacetylase